MTPETPVRSDIVLLGGGHAHVAVLKRFGMQPMPGVRLTLIARDIDTPYSGMLPGLVAGHYTHGETHVDLRPLARFAQVRLYHAAATGIDAERRLVHVGDRPPVSYDLLSVDVGSTPVRGHIDGAAEHAIPVKPVDRFLARLHAELPRLIARDGPVRIVVVGAGAGGVELALCLHYLLTERHGLAPTRLAITILTDRDQPLPGHSAAVRQRLQAALAARRIDLRTGTAAARFEAGRVHTSDGQVFDFDAAVLATHASAPAWLANTGLALDDRGFIAVGPTLQSTSHPEIFAAGDIAAFTARPLPKSGVYAVRQGPLLADNLRRAANGRPLRPYKPQPRTLALISTGDRNAIASYGSLALQGAWVWRAKDWIDRRWMRKYQVLPDMAAETGPADDSGHPIAMRCGGCGAKVAGSVLRRVLDRLRPSHGPDVLVGLDQPDDAAVLTTRPGHVLVQSVDQFRAFIDDPYLFGRIAANHALGDIHAMGATPHTAQALVTLPYASEAKLEDDLYQLLSGALSVLAAAGVSLVGGHTAEGAELALGFAVNGQALEVDLLRKGGIHAGDALVLSKPLGTGAIFAADMQGKAAGQAVESALAAMQQSNGPAVAILRHHGVRAATDVTGFGLIGHLMEMLRASGCAARLEPAAVPAFDGVVDLIAEGRLSSLQVANEAFATAADGIDLANPHHRLLFDPQTAGGLLAALPVDQAADCVAALREAGFATATVIGHAADGEAGRISLSPAA
jgi:selenide,water dikinase